MSLFGKKNTLLESVASRYFDSCLILFGDAKIKDLIKGKFPAIQYTLSGYDISELPTDDKVALISLLFHLDVNERGEKQAIPALEDAINKVKERLGADKDFTDLLLSLPEGVFAAQKLKIIPRQDLESQFMVLVGELQKTRDALNTSVSKQTLDLAAEKDILKITLYNASDGVFALDKDGLIITFNKKMEDLTGYKHEEVKGKKADEVVRLFDDSMPLDSAKYSPTVENPTDRNVYSNNKVTLVSRTGIKKYVRMISAVLNEPTEKNLGSIVTLTDITKEIELENMKIDFVSIAAHELRTPLTSIRGYLELLSSKTRGF
jgi:PAS domain S-box-containing protein